MANILYFVTLLALTLDLIRFPIEHSTTWSLMVSSILFAFGCVSHFRFLFLKNIQYDTH